MGEGCRGWCGRGKGAGSSGVMRCRRRQILPSRKGYHRWLALGRAQAERADVSARPSSARAETRRCRVGSCRHGWHRRGRTRSTNGGDSGPTTRLFGERSTSSRRGVHSRCCLNHHSSCGQRRGYATPFLHCYCPAPLLAVSGRP